MRIEFHGVLAEAAGGSERELAVATPARVSEILDRLTAEMPTLADYLPRVACAVGDELVPRSQTISGDRALVLLPPVSGG